MGTDFYPRLTAVIREPAVAVRIINEQIEIGILLTLPGLLATLALSDVVVRVLYSSQFLAAAQVLVWLVVGVFGRVLSWPLGYILLASGAGRWFAATGAVFFGAQAAMVTWLIPRAGVIGAAYAFAACYLLYTIGMTLLAGRLIGYRWSGAALRLLTAASAAMLVAVALKQILAPLPAALMGSVLALLVGFWCVRGIVCRVGANASWALRLKRLGGRGDGAEHPASGHDA